MAPPTRHQTRGPLWMAAMLLSASTTLAARGDVVVDTALDFFTGSFAGFTGSDAAAILDRVEALRPAPVSPAERRQVLATLPAEGEVRDLTPLQRQKLAAVRRMLELHGREAVYAIKVIDIPQAAVALHGRVVVLISEPALDLLDAHELQALVGHEVGHEFFWRDYARARAADDRAELRRLELLCDGVAIVTLRRAGLDAKPLTSALDRVVRYNRDRFGAALNEDHYPAIGDRRTFAKRLTASLDRSASRRSVTDQQSP